jgi:ferredoxin
VIKVQVDMDLCQNYGQCVFEAPRVFHLDDDDKLVYSTDAEDDDRDNVENAVDVCPMQAIRIVE